MEREFRCFKAGVVTSACTPSPPAMSSSTPVAARDERLRRSLEALPGVQHALIDAATGACCLICDPHGQYPPVEPAARALLIREGADATRPAVLHITYPDAPQPRRRVRFTSLSTERPTAGLVKASVRLEWSERVYEGHAEAESSIVGDLRVCAQATLCALEAVLEGALAFHLVGVKAARIFDQEVVVVLAYVDGPQPGRQLLGTAITTDDQPMRAAVLAVLNATNRTLGNYLVTAD